MYLSNHTNYMYRSQMSLRNYGEKKWFCFLEYLVSQRGRLIFVMSWMCLLKRRRENCSLLKDNGLQIKFMVRCGETQNHVYGPFCCWETLGNASQIHHQPQIRIMVCCGKTENQIYGPFCCQEIQNQNKYRAHKYSARI